MDTTFTSAELLRPDQLMPAWLYIDSLEKQSELDRGEADRWREAILTMVRRHGWDAVIGSPRHRM